MATTEYHVTRSDRQGVYGHPTTRCDESGCGIGTEFFLGDRESIQADRGDVVEIEDDNDSMATEAARRRGELVR